MAEVIITNRFVEDAAQIWSERILGHLRNAVTSIEAFPESGSPDVPESIRREFGEGVRKLVVVPFDLVYEYDSSLDTVTIYGLVPCVKVT